MEIRIELIVDNESRPATRDGREVPADGGGFLARLTAGLDERRDCRGRRRAVEYAVFDQDNHGSMRNYLVERRFGRRIRFRSDAIFPGFLSK